MRKFVPFTYKLRCKTTTKKAKLPILTVNCVLIVNKMVLRIGKSPDTKPIS